MDLDLARPFIKLTLVPDSVQRSVGRIFFFVPYHIKVYLSARIFDAECYASELIVFVPYTTICVLAVPLSLVGSTDKSVRMIFERVFVEDEDFARRAPRMVKLARGVGGWVLGLQEKVRGVRDVNVSKAVKPLFTPTPEEAVKFQQSFRRSRSQAPIPRLTPGAIRIYYYSTLAKGREKAQPDAWLDLYIDSHTGIDLGRARRAWGLESLAIITDKDPRRSIFHPADQDHLSLLAAYDLSNQWTQPIRVFEPHTSSITPTFRNIRASIHPILFFLFTLLKLIIGFPEANTAYLGTLYGTHYASLYSSLGKYTFSLRRTALEALGFVVLLPFVVLFKLILGVKALGVCGLDVGVSLGRAGAGALQAGVATVCQFEMKHWLIVLAVCWYAFAEYLGSKA